ncbi:MAG: hypothetical protein NTZ05_05140 [Chloroflexi bacterium]|nr:hypothetical protein [Chloroflexota bacterium]
MAANKWWTNPAGQQRLLVEQQAMSERFPHFRLRDMGDFLGWSGTLTTPRGTVYRVLVQYPPSFPDAPPVVFPVEPAVEAVDDDGVNLVHQYGDGHLCLYFPGDHTFHDKSTAVTVVAVAAAWFFAYEEWLASGRRHWPGAAADMQKFSRASR